MWIFGHVGLGYRMAGKKRSTLPLRYLLLGTLLPDFIDKPLYMLAIALTGKSAADAGLISGTRTFGHSLLFLSILLFIYFLKKSVNCLALAAGTLTHLILDYISKFDGHFTKANIYFFSAVLWPLFGTRFPIQDTHSILTWRDLIPPPAVALGEILGLLVIARSYRKENWQKKLFASKVL